MTIFPATCSFVRWCRKNSIGHKAYRGGWEIAVHEGGQSIELKSAYAHAFAKVLQEAGLKAYAGSRLD